MGALARLRSLWWVGEGMVDTVQRALQPPPRSPRSPPYHTKLFPRCVTAQERPSPRQLSRPSRLWPRQCVWLGW